MTIPLELRLASTPDGPRLTWTPARELESLRRASRRFDPATLKPGDANPLANLRADLVELRAEIEPGDAAEIVFTVRGARIVFESPKQELTVNGHRAPAPLRGGKQRLAIFSDRTALEVFASDGLTYIPLPFIPKADDLALSLSVTGGAARITSLAVHELASIWP